MARLVDTDSHNYTTTEERFEDKQVTQFADTNDSDNLHDMRPVMSSLQALNYF